MQILAVAGLVTSAAVQAEDFQVQLQLGYDKINIDESPEDADVITGTGTFYFKPVPTDGVPVGEAAYIARSSYLDVVATQVSIGDNDADAYAANVGYHFTNNMFFIRAGVVHTDDTAADDDTTWNGTLGIVPIPRLFFGTDFTEDDWDPNLTARYAAELANHNWYAASISLVDVEDGDTEVGLQFDYYFPTFKLGGGFQSGSDLWTARAEFGLPHGFALLGRVYTDDFGDGFGLTLTWRDL
ncbi:MAG TPA: putative porin [Steroidobacteraceae bacterium]|nr:putative porin [Steroidobacteraceae bacterium]